MNKYNFTIKLQTKKFNIQIDPEEGFGYFEHEHFGDDLAGRLWFRNKTLIDYDGVFELPKEVVDALYEADYNVDYVSDDYDSDVL